MVTLVSIIPTKGIASTTQGANSGGDSCARGNPKGMRPPAQGATLGSNVISGVVERECVDQPRVRLWRATLRYGRKHERDCVDQPR